MGHRLDQRRLDGAAFAELVAEPEDHQQGVVDGDTETDQCDQELDDDRDIGDVGQRQDQSKRVEDRRQGDHQRHQHGRQRPKHEQQDDQRAEPADHGLEQHARPATGGVFGGFLEGVVTGDVDGDVGGKPVGSGGAHLTRAALGIEPGWAGRVHLLEDGVPVL